MRELDSNLEQISGGEVSTNMDPMCQQHLNDLVNAMNMNDPHMMSMALTDLINNCGSAHISGMTIQVDF